MNDKKLSKIFRSNSDCYANTRQFTNDSDVIQAMSEEKFITVFKNVNYSENDSLANKFKLKIIESLKTYEMDMDEPYLFINEKSYTIREIISELENDTDIGIKLMSNILRMAFHLTAKNSFKQQKNTK